MTTGSFPPINIAQISEVEDRSVREKLDSLAAREDKLAHIVEIARNNYNASNATYEAMRVVYDERFGGKRKIDTKRISQVGVSFAMFVLLLAFGVPLFQQGRAAGSLSYASLGLVMICFALLLAAAALVLMFRPDQRKRERKDQLERAQQIALQDQKKLEAALADEQALQEHITNMLVDMGLGAAGSSIRRARVLLDEAKEARSC